MSRWCASLIGFLIGLHAVQGCVETHVRCEMSHQWKYRSFRTFHHISTAEDCQSKCSQYGSRVNYFTFDISIHRCLCTANCLIDRGQKAQNDVTGTISDKDPSDLCEVLVEESSPVAKNFSDLVVVGVEENRGPEFLDLSNNKTLNCTLVLPTTSTFPVKVTVIENQVHACFVGGVLNFTLSFVCRKYDEATKTWSDVDTVPVRDFLDFPLLPNGHVVFMSISPNVYVYDGKKINLVSQNFPIHSNGLFSISNCIAVLSNEEVVIGMAQKSSSRHDEPDQNLYIINLITGNRTKIGPTPPIVSAKCGAYGPQGNRKLFIFGGRFVDYENQIFKPFKDTVIFDRNSLNFTMSGEDVSKTADAWGQVTPYGDTFFFSDLFYTRGILLLDYKESVPQLRQASNVRGSYMFMSTLPSNAFNCQEFV